MNLGIILKPLYSYLLIIIALALVPGLSVAAVSDNSTPQNQQNITLKEADNAAEISFVADEMQHDRELDIVTARGNVQVQNEDRILNADVIVYNRRQDFVTASGNVTLLEPTGEVIFSEFMELSGDFKDGVIADLRSILNDGSLIAANSGRRIDANILDMSRAVYSPCRLCEDDPSRPPLWQIKAVRVTHNKKNQTIEYRDAWLEIAGIPVFYTPYISQPDPTVRKQSGFLTPSFGSTKVMGSFLTTPYYYNIASNADATIRPTFSTKESVIMAGEYRHKFVEGDFEMRGSIKENTPASDQTYTTEKGISGFRGHIAAQGRFEYDQTWRWGFDVNKQSDEAYMTRYLFSGDNTLPEIQNTLASQAFVEGFRNRNYIYANATSFETSITNREESTVPLILPMVDFYHVGESDRYGGYSTLDMNMLALTRTEGSNTRRLSARGGWNLPYVAPAGDTYNLSVKLMGDFYNSQEIETVGQTSTLQSAKYAHRLVPQVALDWRYPFVSTQGDSYQMLEPIASVVVSPYGGNSASIPNEDSQNLEFDDTNLFSDNRFTGLDRIEGGPRINYGFKWSMDGKNDISSSMLLGQSYRYKTDDTFAAGSGLEDNFSDIVGRVQVAKGSIFDVYYRTRINKANLEARRNEINLNSGAPAMRLNLNYVYFERQQGSEFAGREEISGSLTSQLTNTWRSSINARRDLVDKELRSMNLNLTYEDECLLFSTSLSRTFFQNDELHPENSIIFRILFKTLGEVNPDVTVLNPNKTN